MVSRALTLVLLLLASYSIGVGQGASLFLPRFEERMGKAAEKGARSQLAVIASQCNAQGGFVLERLDGEHDLFMCLGPVDGYQLRPDGKPIKPPRRGLHPKQSESF
jgi:hypothetical protein